MVKKRSPGGARDASAQGGGVSGGKFSGRSRRPDLAPATDSGLDAKTLRYLKSASTLRLRRRQGLVHPGGVPKRLPFATAGLRDWRIESGWSVPEVWERLRQIARDNPWAWCPRDPKRIFRRERTATTDVNIIRTFALLYGKSFEEAERACAAPDSGGADDESSERESKA